MRNLKQNDTCNSRSNRHRHTVIQKVPEQLTWKARYEGATKHPYWALKHTSESAVVAVQSIQHGKQNYMYRKL